MNEGTALFLAIVLCGAIGFATGFVVADDSLMIMAYFEGYEEGCQDHSQYHYCGVNFDPDAAHAEGHKDNRSKEYNPR